MSLLSQIIVPLYRTGCVSVTKDYSSYVSDWVSLLSKIIVPLYRTGCVSVIEDYISSVSDWLCLCYRRL